MEAMDDRRIPPGARFFSTSLDVFYLEPGSEMNRIPMTLYDAELRIMKDRNPSRYEEYMRAERQLDLRPSRYPWINLSEGANPPARPPAIKRPQKKSSPVVVSVDKIPGEVVVMCLRPVFALGASLVKRLVATGAQEAASQSVVQNPNSASSTLAAAPSNIDPLC